MLAAPTMHRRLGARYAIGLLVMMNDAIMRSVVSFHHFLHPAGSSNVIKNRGTFLGMLTAISITLLQAVPKLSDFPAEVWQAGDCSIHDWPNGHINHWCNYLNYRIIIPRPVAWDWLCIVFTHALPSNVRIHIGNDKPQWLDKVIGPGIAMQH